MKKKKLLFTRSVCQFWIMLIIGIITCVSAFAVNYHTIYNNSFSANADGWTGCTYDSTLKAYKSITNWEICTIQLNQSIYSWFNISLDVYTNQSQYYKMYYNTRDGLGLDAPNVMLVNQTGYMILQTEPGYNSTGILNYSQIVHIDIVMNKTSGRASFYARKADGTSYSILNNAVTDGNYTFFRIQTGQMSGITYIDNFKYQVLESEENNTYSVPVTYGTLTADAITPNADFTTEQNASFTYQVNVTCTGGACQNVSVYLDPTTALIDTATDGPLSGATTAEADYYTIVNNGFFQNNTGNRAWVELPCSYPGGTCMFIPWYTASNSFATFHSATGCKSGATKGSSYNMSNFYMVTDEFSQAMQLASMSNDGRRFRAFLNTVKAINSTSDGHGSLTEWCIGVDYGTINKSLVHDTASDADARIIDSLMTCADNPNFNSTIREECYDYGSTMASDFLNKNLLVVAKNSLIDGTSLNWLPCGGSNVCTSRTNDGFMYTGYYGDVAISLLKMCKKLNNDTYCSAANDVMLAMMQASGSTEYWTSTTGPKYIEGVNHKWQTYVEDPSSVGREVCTSGCGTYWDYDDAPRIYSVGIFMFWANRTGTTVSSYLNKYLTDWADDGTFPSGSSPCMTSTSFAIQRYPDSKCGALNSGYYETALGAELAFWTNQSRVSSFLYNGLGSAHYNPTTVKWDTTGEFGIFRQAHPVKAFGIALGLDRFAYQAYNGTSGSTTKGLVSTTVNATPYYTTNDNPSTFVNNTCLANMVSGSSCLVNWTVYARGTIGLSYDFYAYASSAVSSQVTTETHVNTIVPSNYTPPACVENWYTEPWGVCQPNGTQSRNVYDLADCGTTVYKPITTQSCYGYDCATAGAGYNESVNLTIYNEQDRTAHLTGDISVDLMWGDTPINFQKAATDSLAICIQENSSVQHVYGTVINEVAFAHNYYFIDSTFNLTPQYIKLFNFNTTTSISTLQTYVYDNSYNEYPDVIVKMDRYYPINHTWENVQQDKSDIFGQTVFHIEEEDTSYRLNFYDSEGNFLYTSGSFKLVCTSALCYRRFNLPATASSSSLVVSSSYDNDTKTINVAWSDPLYAVQYVNLLVQRETMAQTTTVCNTTAYTYSGDMSCSITGLDGHFVYQVYSNENPAQSVLYNTVDIAQIRLADYISSDEYTFWAFGIMLIIICVGLVSPVALIFCTIFGMFIITMLGINPIIGNSLLILAAVIGILIGYVVKK